MAGPDENPETQAGTQSNQQGVCWELAEVFGGSGEIEMEERG
jgi:hypothetical protein